MTEKSLYSNTLFRTEVVNKFDHIVIRQLDRTNNKEYQVVIDKTILNRLKEMELRKDTHICIKCHMTYDYKPKYCPNCKNTDIVENN